jgi:hypothetical protein
VSTAYTIITGVPDCFFPSLRLCLDFFYSQLKARLALKFGEDGACKEVASSAQQRERKKWIMLESREVLLGCSKMATRWALGSWKVMEGSGGGRWMRDKLSRASGEVGPMLEIGI